MCSEHSQWVIVELTNPVLLPSDDQICTSRVPGAAPYTQSRSSAFANRYIVGSAWNDTALTRSSISGTPEETSATGGSGEAATSPRPAP